MPLLKRDNVERIVEDEAIVKKMLGQGWQVVEQPKKSKKKISEGTE